MNRDDVILEIGIGINVIETYMDIQDYMTTEEIQHATIDDEHIGVLSNYVLHGWPSTQAEVQTEVQQ